MLVNPAGSNDVEVRKSLSKMAHAITMHAQDMTFQVNRLNVQRENPPVRSMADRQQEFTRMNPPIFTGSKTSEDPQGVSPEARYTTSLMSNNRNEMSRFLTGIVEDLE